MQIKKLKIGSKIIKTLGKNIRQRQKVQELQITQEIVKYIYIFIYLLKPNRFDGVCYPYEWSQGKCEIIGDEIVF